MHGKLDKRKRHYKCLRETTVLAELIGILLGDGHIHKFPRTEHLVITCGTDKSRYIKRIVDIMTKVFGKVPNVLKRKAEATCDISLYQCELSRRLEMPAGNKIKNNVGVPAWIKKRQEYAIHCLKGLFETDGCFQKDPSNYAQFIEIKNLCNQIRLDTYSMLIDLGYNPQISTKYVRLARKEEVHSFIELVKFREY